MLICTGLQNILLQDREGQDYCVACNDLASDSGKDDPGTSIQDSASSVWYCVSDVTVGNRVASHFWYPVSSSPEC